MKISKIRPVKTPTRGTEKSAGIDLYVPDGYYLSLQPGDACCIPSGIKANIPGGHALIAFNKSGIALKKNLHVGACVVDEDYQGEIHLNLQNVGSDIVRVEAGEKIVQFILLPVFYDKIEEVEVEILYKQKTTRGEGGFGSTGIR